MSKFFKDSNNLVLILLGLIAVFFLIGAFAYDNGYLKLTLPIREKGIRYNDVFEKKAAPTISEEETDVSVTPTPFNITIPSYWRTYDKKFAGSKFYFRYPSTHTISDGDPDSGEIYIYQGTSSSGQPNVVIDNLLHIFQTFEPYKTGSRRIWLRDNFKDFEPDVDFSSLSFEEINFENGKSYLKVGNWPTENGFSNNSPLIGDFYFGIQNNKAVYLSDKGYLDRDTIYKILYSLEIE